MKLSVGRIAPDFTLADQSGNTHTLSTYRGKYVLVYFYPKDDTSGCTVEACSVRDNLPKFQDLNAVVLGISADNVVSHQKFAQKNALNFSLLADTDKKVIEAYDVWGEKVMMGKKCMGIRRTSFLIDPEGKIAKIYEQVKPEQHIQEVLDEIKSHST